MGKNGQIESYVRSKIMSVKERIKYGEIMKKNTCILSMLFESHSLWHLARGIFFVLCVLLLLSLEPWLSEPLYLLTFQAHHLCHCVYCHRNYFMFCPNVGQPFLVGWSLKFASVHSTIDVHIPSFLAKFLGISFCWLNPGNLWYRKHSFHGNRK